MTLFWISTVILTLIACALVALPLLKQKANNDDILRDELNKAFIKIVFLSFKKKQKKVLSRVKKI